ncbi:MAG: PstS family phosphate ABC transporter substrate-binding protein [Candidatus Omnitrophica bacterium]|nr:PstS family phosphate ABC transporter substrate-binding protein [Candidatus Omnitrophota bacterium]
MKKAAGIMIAIFLFSCTAFAENNMVQIKGSDTLINLVQKMSEVYMEKYPGKNISVTGGGSGTGIAALINKKTDIANASRLIKAKEIQNAEKEGVTPKRVVIAIDGLSVIVNKDNSVLQLTVDQIGKIFRGEITNWSEVGGDDQAITLYGRQSNSGTFEFLREVVLKGDYSSNMRQMNGNSQIIEAVKTDIGGIGYVGVGYAKEAEDINIVKVARNSKSPFCSPLNVEDVKSGKYPLSRPLNQYVNGTPANEAKEFILFELSPAGQKIVEEQGFFAIPDEYIEHNESIIG